MDEVVTSYERSEALGRSMKRSLIAITFAENDDHPSVTQGGVRRKGCTVEHSQCGTGRDKIRVEQISEDDSSGETGATLCRERHGSALGQKPGTLRD